MIVYEKYAIEQDEDYLVGSLANINESIKSKDKHLFLENVSNFYHNNIKDYSDKNLKKIKELKEKKNKLKKKGKTNPKDDIFYKISGSHSFESIQNLNVDFDDLSKKLDILSINSNCSTISSNFIDRSPINLFINDPILAQNILQTNITIKILVIGDENVGKTFFVNKFLKNEKIHKDYIPSESLEISKKLIYLVNKCIKLEIYDTNKKILNSPLFKTYISICDCFIFIFDPTIEKSIAFLEEKLEKLKNIVKSPNILLIGNIRFIECKDDRVMMEKNKKFKENDKFVKNIIEKYKEKPNYIDLNNIEIFKKDLKKFLIRVFLTKRTNLKKTSLKKTSSKSVFNKNQVYNNLEIRQKKIIKSLSFNLSKGDSKD